MNSKDLKAILQNRYSQEKWIKTLQFLSGSKNLLSILLEPKHEEIKSAKAKEIVRDIVRLGTLKTSDGITLPIFDVILQDDIKIEYNRVGVNDLLKTYIFKDAIKGAIITFHYREEYNKDEWRFSFISKFGSDYFVELESIETNPKKYTYIFGTPEEHRTALERLYNLEQSRFRLEDFFEAFNVEPVSNNFFKEYKNFYQDFVFEISNNKQSRSVFEKEKISKDDLEKEIRNFVKRLLGRLVFLYFLQKKRWLGATNKNYDNGDPNFLYNLFNYSEESRVHFYNKWLSLLFFNALNTPNRPNDEFQLADGSLVLIPFLNGGLFEESQEPEKHRNIQFPPTLFELLFKFFNGYNFTIYENSPEDHTVAVDPEMLGNIFENLLEDNKDKGAFYTPKEIVHYMTQESLIEYLKTHLSHSRESIENLIKNHITNDFSKDDLKQVEKLIDQVKICDPAIGSGAFPMGLLHEISGLKALFHFELNKKPESWKPADIKQNIIQNSIYGVDLENDAVDIARLRFWLSLVVDEPTPKPLPNLDYKIMQGNSLLESFEGIDLSKVSFGNNLIVVEDLDKDLFGNLKDDQMKITVGKTGLVDKIQKLITNYFTAKTIEKPKIRLEINNAINEHIDYNLDLRKIQLTRQIKELKAVKSLTLKQQKALTDFKNCLENLNQTKNDLLLQMDKSEKPYFLWHLFFGDVFKDGGFDIVIGNPPYIQLQKMGKEADKLLNENYKSFSRTGDIYALFYEKGLGILKERGVLSYITSNKWMRANYGISLRKLFTQYNPKYLLDLGPNVFNTATVDTNIIFIEKQPNKDELLATTIEKKKDITTITSNQFIQLNNISEEMWNILRTDEHNIMSQIENKGKFFKKWDIKINRGVLTGYNEAFIITKEKKDELIRKDPNSSDLLKPVIRGREVQKFISEWDETWLVSTLPSKNIDIDLYPIIKSYLESFQPRLNQEGKTYKLDNGEIIKSRKKSSNKWFETQDPIAFYKEFEKPKIIWKRIGSIMRFAYSEKGEYCLDSTCIATGEKLKYLTGLLNSKVSIYYLEKTAPKTGTGDAIISVQALEPLPVYYPDEKSEILITIMVDLILFCKTSNSVNDIVKNEQISQFFEELIDGCVFELYFEEHMKGRGINIIDDVKDYLEKCGIDETFESLSEEVKKLKIWELYKTMSTGVVQVKMTDFVTKSPDILKPILQS